MELSSAQGLLAVVAAVFVGVVVFIGGLKGAAVIDVGHKIIVVVGVTAAVFVFKVVEVFRKMGALVDAIGDAVEVRVIVVGAGCP